MRPSQWLAKHVLACSPSTTSQRSRRPPSNCTGTWKYMTPVESLRLLEELARKNKKMNLSSAKRQPAKIVKDDNTIAVGASFCSSTGRFVEFSKKPPVDAWDDVRPNRARQPRFKGVERNLRRLTADIWH